MSMLQEMLKVGIITRYSSISELCLG